MKRLLAWLRATWLIAGVTLLCLLLADSILLRLLPESRELTAIDPRAAAPAAEHTEALAAYPWVGDYFSELRAARKTRWEPYSYWRRRAYSGTYINIDREGLRHGWSPPQPRLSILMLGGSTVWGTGSRDSGTLPSALARALARRGLAVEVLNLGETGYVSGQEFAALSEWLRRHPPPDGVIFFDGVNDVYAALQSDRPGRPQNEWHRERDFRVTDGLDNWLSAFPTVLQGAQRLAGRLRRGAERPTVASLAAAVSENYLKNVRMARALGREFGFATWFFWQPSVFAKSPRSSSEALIHDASLVRHRDLQVATDAAIGASGGGVHDFSGLFADTAEALFFDFCHLSEAGNQQLAERMAGILFPELGLLAAQEATRD